MATTPTVAAVEGDAHDGASLGGTTTEPPPPRLIYLFGGPGCGKNHVGRVLASQFGYTFQDADEWLPEDMIEALKHGEAFTTEMRDRYYAIIRENVANMLSAAPPGRRLVVAQATYKNRHRALFQKRFPTASLWHVDAPPAVCIRRVTARSGNGTEDGTAAMALARGSAAADEKWVLQHASGFETPTHYCEVLYNDDDSDPSVLTHRIQKLLGSTRPVVKAGTE